jgi:hypothetical protein
MGIPHDEGFRDPRRRPAERAGEWIVGGLLVALGVLMLFGVLGRGLGRITSNPFFPWLLIGLGIGVPLIRGRRARKDAV